MNRKTAGYTFLGVLVLGALLAGCAGGPVSQSQTTDQQRTWTQTDWQLYENSQGGGR